MTHLSKHGFAPPYRAKTACGLTVDAFDVVDESPECAICHEAYLQQLVNEEAQTADWEAGLLMEVA